MSVPSNLPSGRNPHKRPRAPQRRASSPRPSLAAPTQGREAAISALTSWEEQHLAMEAALEQASTALDSRERRLAFDITYGVVRWLSRLNAILAQLLTQPLSDLPPRLRILLRAGLYQLRPEARMPSHAVVDESVKLCRVIGHAWASGLVNAVLRRYLREQERLETDSQGDTLSAKALRYAHPEWLVSRLAAVDPDGIDGLLLANQLMPPLVLRINPLKTDVLRYLELLKARGIEGLPCRYAPHGLRVSFRGDVTELPGFMEGVCLVQDEGSQLAAEVVGPEPGDRILDACAAPGSKALQLAAVLGPSGLLVATDASSSRLERLRPMAARHVPGRILFALRSWGVDDTPLRPPLAVPFDRVLVDAPCSGLGVIRRIPEIKWRRTEEDLRHYPKRQLSILEAAADCVRPGGTLVYSVCTPLLEEGPGVIASFLQRRPEFQVFDLRQLANSRLQPLVDADGFLRSFPHRHDCDGFFVARLTRRASPDAPR